MEAVSQFLAQAETNSQAAQVWAQLNEQARLEREAQKFFGLVKGGVYVNSLEVGSGCRGANKTFSRANGPERSIRRFPIRSLPFRRET